MNKAEQLIESFRAKLDIFDLFLSSEATTRDIQEVEDVIGLPLPETMKHLLKITNGEGNEKYNHGTGPAILGFGFLSTHEIISHWNFFKESADFDTEINQEKFLNPNLYSPRRIPFAHDDGSGQFLCVDYDPNTDGIKGQIIYLPCGEPEPISVIANNFDDYLDFLIDSILSERLYLVDDREDYDKEEWDRAEIYFETAWRDDWTDIAEEYNNKVKLDYTSHKN